MLFDSIIKKFKKKNYLLYTNWTSLYTVYGMPINKSKENYILIKAHATKACLPCFESMECAKVYVDNVKLPIAIIKITELGTEKYPFPYKLSQILLLVFNENNISDFLSKTSEDKKLLEKYLRLISI